MTLTPAPAKDIRDGIAQWYDNLGPYGWKKTAAQILEPLARRRRRISAAGN
ncbi:hypothetical protein [Microtetraspora malaysiensis]|uniref:hypothetical protein n=1 Tax=Microtetraspora malaysiensis TaxID=161358 RepID=UPI003D8F8F17